MGEHTGDVEVQETSPCIELSTEIPDVTFSILVIKILRQRQCLVTVGNSPVEVPVSIVGQLIILRHGIVGDRLALTVVIRNGKLVGQQVSVNSKLSAVGHTLFRLQIADTVYRILQV